MKTIEEMRQAIDGLRKQLGDIKANAAAAGREYDEAERKLVKKIQARIKDLMEQIELELTTESLDREINTSQTEPPKIDPSTDNPAPYGTRLRTKEAEFRTLGEQLVAVVIAGQDGGHVDPRLIYEERATGLSEGLAAGGGYI